MLGFELPLSNFLFLTFVLLSYRTNKQESNNNDNNNNNNCFLNFKYRTNEYSRLKSHTLL